MKVDNIVNLFEKTILTIVAGSTRKVLISGYSFLLLYDKIVYSKILLAKNDVSPVFSFKFSPKLGQMRLCDTKRDAINRKFIK